MSLKNFFLDDEKNKRKAYEKKNWEMILVNEVKQKIIFGNLNELFLK